MDQGAGTMGQGDWVIWAVASGVEVRGIRDMGQVCMGQKVRIGCRGKGKVKAWHKDR